jgi:hypothetical protein
LQTIKVPDQGEYLLPQHCVYCNAERPIRKETTWDNLNVNKLSRHSLHNKFKYYRCPKCRKLHLKAKILNRFIPLIVLLFTLLLLFTLSTKEIITNSTFRALFMLGLLVAAIVISAFFENSANTYLIKNGYIWGLSSLNKSPVKENRSLKEKGYLVLDFTNEDYARSFAELNHGVVITKH